MPDSVTRIADICLDVTSSNADSARTCARLVVMRIPPVTTAVSRIDADGFRLEQNHPNPFFGSTAITFTLASDERVLLTVYNALGVEVARLVDGRRSAGTHTVTFDASAMPQGVYFYRLAAGRKVMKRVCVSAFH
jgi:hypothetical protein